jgi:hypothetical protein
MSLIAELKRRNVFRVGVAYAIVAWLLLEVASVVLPALHLPEWTLTLLVFLVVAGFPLALIVAWAFELTPEGIKRETAVDPAESITHVTGRKLDFAIIGHRDPAAGLQVAGINSDLDWRGRMVGRWRGFTVHGRSPANWS